jgi:beta-phosphoglucomutase-like phosphatase (HAD superfamily)
MQAYGLIFSLDHLITDTRQAWVAAWHALAASEQLPPPPDASRLLLPNVCPERIMTDVSGCTRVWGAGS